MVNNITKEITDGKQQQRRELMVNNNKGEN